MEKEKENLNINQTSIHNVRPWVRFFARNIDIYIFALFLVVILSIFSPSSIPKSNISFGMVALFLWILVESVFLSTLGTTFGKWLLKVKVRDNEGRKLTFPVALKRSFLVWLKGLGIGFPIISLLTLISSHSDLTKRGGTSWDKDCHSIVTHQKIGIVRTAVSSLFLVLYVFLIFLAKKA